MKKLTFLLIASALASCTTVDSGNKGLEISWGGKTNMDVVYSEGMHSGFHWIWDDMVQYDVREKTLVQKFEFNDKNNMLTGVEFSLDYSLSADNLSLLHTKVTDYEVKISKTLKSAAKEIVPQYSASELNLTKREEAESKLSEILSQELPEFYINFARVQLTDVDIPKTISDAAEATAKQIEVNKLAEEREHEAEKNFNAAEWNAKTKDILSQPKMLELQRIENERLMWEGFVKHGKSPYGENNVFGSETSVIKGLK